MVSATVRMRQAGVRGPVIAGSSARVISAYPATSTPTTTCGTQTNQSSSAKPKNHGVRARNTPVTMSRIRWALIGTSLTGLAGLVVMSSLSTMNTPTPTADQVAASLSSAVTRDHMHQMQWLSAIEELKADGLDGLPVPEAFPLEEEFDEFSRTFIQASDGEAAAEGSWASGPAPDGRGDFRSALIHATGEWPELAPGDPRLYGTNPLQETKGLIDKAKDALS